MNKQETAKVLAMLREYYPNGKGITQATVNAWYMALKEYDYQITQQAVYSLVKTDTGISTLPTVGKLIEQINLILPKDNSDIALWNEAVRLMRKGTVLTPEEFKAASPILQQWFRNIETVREFASLPYETIQTVTRGQFIKTIDVLKKREEAHKNLPESIREKLRSPILKQIERKEK